MNKEEIIELCGANKALSEAMNHLHNQQIEATKKLFALNKQMETIKKLFALNHKLKDMEDKNDG